jgi:DNA segregation ATPase FtsK/SpoIIIE, S-DNA-T family
MLTRHQQRQLLGLALLALTVFTTLSVIPLGEPGPGAFPEGNVMGVLGRWFAGAGFGAIGAGTLLVPVLLGLGAAAAFGWIELATTIRWVALATGLIILLPAAAALFARGSGIEASPLLPAGAAGWVGRHISVALVALLGWFGGAFALLVLFIALSVASIGWNPAGSAARGGRLAFDRLWQKASRRDTTESEDTGRETDAGMGAVGIAVPDEPVAEAPAPPRGRRGRRSRRSPDQAELALADTGNPHSEELPPLMLLSEPADRAGNLSEVELDRLGEVLIRTLRTFKVEGDIAGRTTGPVVTQFEVVPAPGVKVNRIAALDADLALALRAPSIRIVAPIPGKGAVGVEVPNPEPEVVYLRRILEASSFQRSRGHLPLALGKDLMGRAYVADLVRMPHLLIAGATGSGKSVCINTLITSLVYRHTPKTLRLLMVDPKMVELSMYSDLPHLRHPVVTDPHDAAKVLKWAVWEMERRYALLSENGARSINEFNRRVEEGQDLRRPGTPPEDHEGPWLYEEGSLPYIVVVVDELADLMITVQAEVEKPLAQLAQKARAIGIHLIVATQRPSVNVITGLIKANFPCRVAFRVSSKVDSRTILDQNGADALLGNGDMLFLPPGTSDPVRIQGAFLSTEDTEHLMAWYRQVEAGTPASEDDILEFVRSREESEASDTGFESLEDRDSLFRQAAEICIQHQQGSTSLLQRKLRIGYGRAARIIDQLHTAGILGPPDGSKPREVLLGLESLEHVIGEF